MNKYNYNLKKDILDSRDYLFKKTFKACKVDLAKSVDLRPKLAPIENQGQLGSCQSFAFGAIKEEMDGNAYITSKLFSYYNARDDKSQDTGTTLRQICDSSKKYGVCEDSLWPYVIENFDKQPPTEAYDNAKNHTISTYHRITSIDEIKQALSMGFIPFIGITVYESFESDDCMQTGIIPAPKKGEQELGGHALDIVAYFDDEGQKPGLFKTIFKKLLKLPVSQGNCIIRNSWGEGIGIDKTGYFKVSYETLMTLVNDMWVITK